MKMPPKIAEFIIQVTIAENPGQVSDPRNLSEDDRRAWSSLWPAWKLEQNALERVLQRDAGRLTADQLARLRDRARRLDRLTYAGPRARFPLDTKEALFAEAVWADSDAQGSTETPLESDDSSSRAQPVGRSKGR